MLLTGKIKIGEYRRDPDSETQALCQGAFLGVQSIDWGVETPTSKIPNPKICQLTFSHSPLEMSAGGAEEKINGLGPGIHTRG